MPFRHSLPRRRPRKGNWNSLSLLRPEQLFLTHVYFVGVSYDDISRQLPLHTTMVLQVHLRDDAGHRERECGAAEAVRLMQCTSFVPAAHGWPVKASASVKVVVEKGTTAPWHTAPSSDLQQ